MEYGAGAAVAKVLLDFTENFPNPISLLLNVVHALIQACNSAAIIPK